MNQIRYFGRLVTLFNLKTSSLAKEKHIILEIGMGQERRQNLTEVEYRIYNWAGSYEETVFWVQKIF